MTKSRGKGDNRRSRLERVRETGLVTNWNTICKKFVFFSCTTRDLRSQIGT